MVQTLRPRSSQHSIDRGYSHTEALSSIHGLQYLGPRMLLSQGTYVAGAPGYLVCLYLGQPASCLCECVCVAAMDLSGLTPYLHLPRTSSSR